MMIQHSVILSLTMGATAAPPFPACEPEIKVRRSLFGGAETPLPPDLECGVGGNVTGAMQIDEPISRLTLDAAAVARALAVLEVDDEDEAVVDRLMTRAAEAQPSADYDLL